MYKTTLYTVDGERFAGLNIRGFSAIKIFTEILPRCLGHKCSLFSTIKERRLNSQKNLSGTPDNYEKRESLAQRIFPRLQYRRLQYRRWQYYPMAYPSMFFKPIIRTMITSSHT